MTALIELIKKSHLILLSLVRTKTIIMKKLTVLLCVALLFFQPCIAQQLYATKNGEISFYSHAPIEDIDAHNTNVAVALNPVNNEIVFSVPIQLFMFDRKKMQQDFNENYMESATYPKSTFTGTINETIDYTKEGTYFVSVTGRLTIHGTEQTRTEKGTMIVKQGSIYLQSDFMIYVKDFNVKIPSLLTQNIAEVVSVKVKATLVPIEKLVMNSGE
jgi:hypothetical protein